MDNKSEGFKIEDYKYKTHRQEIEKAWDNYLEQVGLDSILIRFFGLNEESLKLVTGEEKQKIKMYFGHVYKRIANAHLIQNQKDKRDPTIRIKHDTNEGKITNIEPDKYFQATLEHFFESIMFHDISHSIEAASSKEGSSRKSVDIVPPFFRVSRGEGVNALNLIQTESFAGLFHKQIRGTTLPLSLEILKKGGSDSLSAALREVLDTGSTMGYVWRPEIKKFIERECLYKINAMDPTLITKRNYIEAYLGFIQVGATLGQNLVDMSNSFSEKAEAGEIEELEVAKQVGYNSVEDQEAVYLIARNRYISMRVPSLLNNIKYALENPPRVVVESLEYVYDNRYNPRVLVDLFFKLTESYFRDLDKRYSVKAV